MGLAEPALAQATARPDTYGPLPPGPDALKKPPKREPATPTARPPEQKFRLAGITMRGNQRISDERMLLSLPFMAGEDITPSAIQDGLQRLYQMGYFADVKAAFESSLMGQRVVFTVVENPVFQGIQFEGVTKLKAQDLQALFAPMRGDILNYNILKEGIENIQKRYAEAGYPLARLADMGVSPDGRVSIRISEGRIFALKIEGNDETKDYVIFREMTTKKGEVFDANSIRADLRRVFNLNFFEDVNLKFEAAPSQPEEVVVIVVVKEKQTGSINLGAGYSTRDGILGMFTVKKDNLLGTGQQIGVDLSISQQMRVAGELTYFNPWIDQDRTGLGGSLYMRRFNNFLADFREDRMGASINLSRPLFGSALQTPWRGMASLKAERISTFDNIWFGGNPKPRYSDGKAITLDPQGNDAVVGGSLGISVDTRDVIQNPTEGWFNTLSLEPGLINGFSPILRSTGMLTWFYPLPGVPWAPRERATLAMNARLGLITGAQVPAYERFFSTGPYLIRGWPEFVNPTMPIAQKYGAGFFQGSNAFVSSLEYRFPVFNILSGVFFADTGAFWDDTFKRELWHSGFGAGIRLNTPMGPIRLDYGLSGVEPGQFHFSIGQKF